MNAPVWFRLFLIRIDQVVATMEINKAIRVSKEKNRIYITAADFSREVFEKAIEELELICLEMRPNFTCVLDLNAFTEINEEHIDLIKKGQERIWSAGLGKAVRIVPSSLLELYKNQLAKNLEFYYSAEYVTSLEEADKILDQYQEELDCKNGNSPKEMYQVIGMNNWKDEHQYKSFRDATIRLKKLRKSGKLNTIIVNAKTILNA